MPITLIASFKIKEGKMDEAIALLKEIVTKVRGSEEGCLAYIPHTVKGAKNKNTILFYEKYKDKDALNIHSANLPKNFEKMFPLIDGPMDLKTCTEIL
jgi:quinol monooxygenase YgiN